VTAADVIGRRPATALPACHRDIQSIIPRMHKESGLPVRFTLDACRDGVMTELDEAGLTEGPGRRPIRPPDPSIQNEADQAVQNRKRTNEKCPISKADVWLATQC
jgi:hypothetical protein